MFAILCCIVANVDVCKQSWGLINAVGTRRRSNGHFSSHWIARPYLESWSLTPPTVWRLPDLL
jgi:hypothetical protein